ncbi:hypothetical protein GCM10010406_02260 [Streptomyces thermolineatus]|uniref:DUF559 domain-containing protein n=1 Tax=Streptomyces thermolineatus TaxID=44033 RepID=A0ABN3KRS7_9ACTN
MNHETPLSSRRSDRPARTHRRVVTARLLVEHGLPADVVADRCRPGGPWQELLPGVLLLHDLPPTPEDRLHAALLYAAPAEEEPGEATDGTEGSGPYGGGSCAPMVTGMAALALHGLDAARQRQTRSRPAAPRVDVLVAGPHRPADAGFVRVTGAVRGSLPHPVVVDGVPCAPVPRALADAVARLHDPHSVRTLLVEAVRGGRCDAASAVRELAAAGQLSRPHVVDAADALLAQDRTASEGLLYEMVRGAGVPDPLWNVDLKVPGGPWLGGVDAYWPDHGVVLELDTRSVDDGEALWSAGVERREHLELLGLQVLRVTPDQLRDSVPQQARTLRTALLMSSELPGAARLVILPR